MNEDSFIENTLHYFHDITWNSTPVQNDSVSSVLIPTSTIDIPHFIPPNELFSLLTFLTKK